MAFDLLNYLPMLSNHVLPFSIFLMSGFLLLTSYSIIIVNKKFEANSNVRHLQSISKFLVDVLRAPTLFLGVMYTLFLSAYGSHYYIHKFNNGNLEYFAFILGIAEFITYFWVTFNLLGVGKNRLMQWSVQTNHPTLGIILPYIEKSLDTVLILLMVNLLIPLINLSGQTAIIVDRISQILLISMIGFFFFQLVNIGEKLISSRYIAHNTNVFSARKINTQLLILKRFIIALIVVITIAYILMLFDKVNSLGKGLLTTAGIISAIGAFASQQSLSRVFAGLQLAFAQPIRIGDTVIVENETGVIEEITLFYIVVKLWDLRRLILPSDYFSNKGMQNLTRQSSQLLGTIFLYTDYTLPVDEVRKKFLELLNESSLWDKKVGALHVTNVNDKAMELRGLMSADNASNLFELRCSMREQMMKFIVHTYPWCLSQSRNINNTPDSHLDPITHPA